MILGRYKPRGAVSVVGKLCRISLATDSLLLRALSNRGSVSAS